MIVLAAADTLAAVASVATQLTCTVFGMELTAGPTETYKVLDQRQLAAAAATIYTAPASTQSFVKTIAVVNTGASATCQFFRGGTAAANAITPVLTVPAGGWAQYDEGRGWSVYDATGKLQASLAVGGRYLRTRVFVSGTSFVVSSDASSIFCRLQAPGGGGGNAVTGATNSAAGGGGASGGYAEKTFSVLPGATVTYTVPAGGASATAGSNATVVSGGVTVTAMGGPAGAAQTVAAPPLVSLGGAAPAVATNGDVNGSGAPGGAGNCEAAAIAVSGQGGSSLFGGGGTARSTQGIGNAAVGFGSGGGGAVILSGGANVAGGAGSAGILIVDEFS
jgi:hypothetical protein